MIEFTVYIEPVAQGRPRFKRFGKPYDPPKSKDFKSMLCAVAQEYVKDKPFDKNIPIKFYAEIYRKTPSSFSKKKKLLAEEKKILPTPRPDWDNYAKGICDGVKSLFWEDDSQICDGQVKKFYSERPRIYVKIEEIKPTDSVRIGIGIGNDAKWVKL